MTKGPASGARSHRRTGVRHRLVLVVLVPTLGLLGFGGHTAYVHSEAAGRARQVEDRVERAGILLQMKLLLTNETFSTGGAATAGRFGLDPKAMIPLVGFDPTVRMAEDRDAIDRLAASAPDVVEVARPYETLLDARRTLDAGTLELAQLLAAYSEVHEDLTLSADAALTAATDAAIAAGNSVGLRRATAALDAAVLAATAVGLELDGLAQLLTPAAPADRQGSLERIRIGLGIGVEADGELDRLASGSLREQWQEARSSASTVMLSAEARRFAAMAPVDVPPVDFDRMILLFAEGMTSLDLFNDVAETAATETMALAADLRQRAENELRAALALVGLVALTSAAVAGLISRSIAAPIRAVAQRAGRVTAGDLTDAGRGTPTFHELTEVSTAFEELVENLRVVEAQVEALAAGDLDHPVLDVPVPGRLGTLLHDSVLRLSRSITDREQLALRLEHDATHDPLTGAANRGSFLDALRLALVDRTTDLAVLQVDLDGFKPVNEVHGHDVGDRLLRVTVARLQADVGGEGLVARIGGDQFGIILTGPAAAEAEVVAARLVVRVSAPVSVGAVVTQVRASVGVAVAEAGCDAGGLAQQARLAVRTAKAAGGGGIARFDAAMLAELERNAELERRLRAAIAGDELVLHFQPVVDEHLRTVSVEALVRWQEPGGRLVPPGDFIPVAEASDLIIEVGLWVLDEACRVLAGWRNDPELGHLRLGVNLSARHVMSMNVVDDVRAALHRHRVSADRLAIEITETVLLGDLAVATEHLSRLRELGVHILVDDFGTGYTSLAQLRQLPVDLLKIDRSLVVAAAERPADARVIELVVGAAHAMGLGVVAEGVETQEQLAMLRAAGCEFVQGYLTGRPGPESGLRASQAQSLAPLRP